MRDRFVRTGFSVASDGCPIAYRLDGPGDGPVLLLANSLGTDMALFEAQVAVIAERRRIARYDMRGHGASGMGPAAVTIARLAQDAIELLDTLDIARIDFCGVSLGGMVGQWLAAHHPERIDRLILANTSAHMPPPDAWQARIDAVRAGGMATVADGVMERWFTPSFRAAAPATIDATRAMLLAVAPEGYAAACGAIRGMDLRPFAGRIAAPTLVIGGEHDPATPPSHSHFLADAIAGARLAVLSTAHLANLESPQAFTRLVTDFLDPG